MQIKLLSTWNSCNYKWYLWKERFLNCKGIECSVSDSFANVQIKNDLKTKSTNVQLSYISWEFIMFHNFSHWFLYNYNFIKCSAIGHTYFKMVLWPYHLLLACGTLLQLLIQSYFLQIYGNEEPLISRGTAKCHQFVIRHYRRL